MKIQKRIQANINLDAIAYNLENIKKNLQKDTQIIAVLKADGYGHGAIPLAKEIESYPYIWGIAVATVAGDANADNFEVLTYEGYGPSGVAIIVQTLTDNKNRTAGNVRSAFTKGSGNIGTPGSVSFMFDKKGQIIIDKEECEMDADDLMMIALDAGAEDFAEEEDSFEVLTDPDEFSTVREALEKEGIPMLEAQVAMIPQNYVTLSDEQDVKNLQKTLDLLDDDDDVTDVWHNWEE